MKTVHMNLSDTSLENLDEVEKLTGVSNKTTAMAVALNIAKTLLNKRYSVREIGLRLNQPSFFLGKFIESVKRFSMKRLVEILDIIYKIDYESKTSGENLAKLNLQNFIFRLKLLKM